MAAADQMRRRSTGSVKFYDRAKEFGFIAGDDGVDRFFNSNQLRTPRLDQGDRVRFECGHNAKGPMAYRVEPLAIEAGNAKPATASSRRECVADLFISSPS